MTDRTAAQIGWICLAVFGALAVVGEVLVAINGAPENFLQKIVSAPGSGTVVLRRVPVASGPFSPTGLT